ncbi:regenerating islet-derived protein 4-like isoform X1 [Crotalus tigris]|uniref:regenerating islet-derived protein 4-like isoform X1 n=2 Tax=Crotalus tigris TaxID=88082 RepID=UPI00192F7C68|nr:regenerating islet-derived protein 4-like isoform X1 [Crotalus tigris]
MIAISLPINSFGGGQIEDSGEETEENKRMGRHTFWGFCLLACLTVGSWVEASPSIQGRAKCPEEAVYYRQQCYQPVDVALTWDAAEIECQQLRSGGHLATFRTAAEERIVSSHIRRSSTTTDAWIGMHAVRTPKKFIWEWTDGTTYTPGSLLWDNRAPSISLSTLECISVTNIHVPGNAARWIQRTCATVLPFICKYKASF